MLQFLCFQLATFVCSNEQFSLVSIPLFCSSVGSLMKSLEKVEFQFLGEVFLIVNEDLTYYYRWSHIVLDRNLNFECCGENHFDVSYECQQHPSSCNGYFGMTHSSQDTGTIWQWLSGISDHQDGDGMQRGWEHLCSWVMAALAGKFINTEKVFV
jgi:hypothetical protein